MSNISFTAHGRCARATYCEPITTGSVGLSVSFAFDAAWSGLQKTAIFRGSGMAVDLVLSGDAATVPPEVLTIPGGDLRIGVWGADSDGNVIIPTVWATVGEIVPGAAPSGFDPDPPTPSWAAQVQEIAQNALNTANSVREDADAGEFDGATYTPAVSAGGELSWTNDKDKPNPPTVNIKGPEGQPGQTGATPDLSIGTVETLPPGSPATATITGTAENPVLSFGIPQGQQGAPGEVTQAEFDELADEVSRQKSVLDNVEAAVFSTESVYDMDEWAFNSNNAVTNNGDGTYTFGTSDYGTTLWGFSSVIPAGEYELFGSPVGFTLISPNTDYRNAVATNETGTTKTVTIPASDKYYVGIRLNTKPSASFVVTPSFTKKVNNIAKNESNIESLTTEAERLDKRVDNYPLGNDFYVAHLFLKSQDVENQLIPSESIFDVQIAKRLGFPAIEGNVHETADGKYVVIHGTYSNGVHYLGDQVEDENHVSGAAVAINSLTLAEIQSTYKYVSSHKAYRGSIPSLDEWLIECKINKIVPVVQYCTDESVEITKSIVGDNYILYNGNRSAHNGYIMMYQDTPSLATIQNWCQTIKPPLMVCFADPNATISSSDLAEMIETVHSYGCKIGFAAGYKNVVDSWNCVKAGCDFASSGWNVNGCEGNSVNVSSERGFSDFTNSNKAVDGVLELADGDTVTLATTPDVCFLSKGILRANFVGTIGLMMGDYIKVYHTSEKKIVSDGTNGFEMSTFYMNQAPNFTIRAVGSVTINTLQFLADKC